MHNQNTKHEALLLLVHSLLRVLPTALADEHMSVHEKYIQRFTQRAIAQGNMVRLSSMLTSSRTPDSMLVVARGIRGMA